MYRDAPLGADVAYQQAMKWLQCLTATDPEAKATFHLHFLGVRNG